MPSSVTLPAHLRQYEGSAKDSHSGTWGPSFCEFRGGHASLALKTFVWKFLLFIFYSPNASRMATSALQRTKKPRREDDKHP